MPAADPPSRILFITSRADYGGGPQHVYYLLQEAAKKFDVAVACPAEPPFWDKFKTYAHCLEIPHRQLRWRSLHDLAGFVRGRRIDLIHSHGKGAGVYSRLLAHSIRRSKILHTFHGIHLALQPVLRRSLEISVERYLSHFTSRYIHVSATERDQAQRFRLYGTRPATVITNGVAVPDHSPAKPPGRPFTLINISRLAPEKGVDTVLFIAHLFQKQFGPFRLQIVGDGPERSRLEKQAQTLGLASVTEFLGFRPDAQNLLREAHVYVTGSRGEAMPLTVMEAMAAGTPVVASQVMGHTDLIENETSGFLYPLSNPAAAVDQILALARSPALFEKISAAAFTRVKSEFSVERMVARTMQVYESLLAG